MRKEVPIALGFVAGAILIIANFFATQVLDTVKKELDQWYLIASAFAILVGMINLGRIHAAKISRKKEGWGFSIVVWAGMVGFVIFGLWRGSSSDPMFQWVYNTTISPMNATMYSILVFYISSAAYRAFRIRSKEAVVLMVSAIIIMLGRVTVGEIISPALPKLAAWIMDYPNTAGMRGITIGATLGGVSQALRILIGVERGHLGGLE